MTPGAASLTFVIASAIVAQASAADTIVVSPTGPERSIAAAVQLAPAGSRIIVRAGTYREPNGGEYGQIASAWLRWQLKGDQQAARQFVGKDCGLCTKPAWHVKSKGL